MTVSDVNTEGACEVAVSQAMKHMRPDSESELLNVEDTFPAQASREAPQPALVSVVACRVEAGLGNIETIRSEEGNRPRGLRTTINDPRAIEKDKMNYLYASQIPADAHIPGICSCEDCVRQKEALMAWAMESAKQQHAQAIAEATAAAEAAQKSGDGPKPMMVTPYKHNWVISGTHPEKEDEVSEESWFDWEGIAADLRGLWKDRVIRSDTCCTAPSASNCRMM